MFDWLFEGRMAVYVTLGVVAIILAALWWRDRRMGWLYAVGVVGLLAGLYLLLDKLVETRYEHIVRRLRDIQSAVKSADAEKVMRQLSSRFSYNGVTREQFRVMVVDRLKNRFLEDLEIWEVSMPDESGTVSFIAKPKGGAVGDNTGFRVRSEFVQDPDGQWRMKGFEVYNSFADSQSPLDVMRYVQ